MPRTTAPPRSNFTDRTKAELFARSKAICAFCGCDLWILRRGLSRAADHDWADHKKPCSRGGGNKPENGITICAECNCKKSNNGRDKGYFFEDGKPTSMYLSRFDVVHPAIAATITANGKIHWSDWYFNRALQMLSNATVERWGHLVGDDPAVRTPKYWAGAALKRVAEWKRYSEVHQVAELEVRGLIPGAPEPDQRLALELLDCATVDDVLELIERLLPHYIGHAAQNFLMERAVDDEAMMVALRDDLGPALDRDGSGWYKATSKALNTMAAVGFGEDMIEEGLGVIEGGKVVPVGGEWPVLPRRRMRAFLGK